MTAQVVLLNRYGIAVASDSAVTVQSGDRVRTYNSAEKITYSEGTPLAVLQSGSDSIFGVPWQVLLKRWIQTQGQKTFSSLEASADDLVSWLNEQPDLVASYLTECREAYKDHLLRVREQVCENLTAAGKEVHYTTEPTAEIAEIIEGTIDSYIHDLGARYSKSEVALERLKRERREFDDILQWAYDDIPVTRTFIERSVSLLELLTQLRWFVGTQTTLAFCGYGTSSYFPSTFRASFSGFFGAGIRYYETYALDVSAASPVAILPLGQTDAMYGFLVGISSEYEQLFESSIVHLRDLSAEKAPDARQVLDEAVKQFRTQLEQLREKAFLESLRDVVGTLPVDEMVRVADALVNLASLREIVRGGSSIGGPIDLARLTRHGGFEWVRHK